MDEKPRSPGIGGMLLSVLASAFGVQSQQNYERDFNGGKLTGYIVIGVLFVCLLIAALAGLVNFFLN